ncbi:MAG: hypothetical protein MUC94_06415 [bacterium]|nr:hypothetical protein [bacterium]
MNKNSSLQLYEKFFVDRDFERLDLFQLLAEKYGIESALYPGSYVHITPSFVFPVTVYIDSDKKAKKFFNDPAIYEFIANRKIYSQNADVTFYAMDYKNDLGMKEQSFELLISQYAGFVSQHCKRYLKLGALLLVNNSHGDASMASIDNDYEFIAVVNKSKGEHRMTEKNLDSYFIPKSNMKITKEYLEKIQKGIGYTKSASDHIFRRIK